jgi:hypothetical protein
MRFVRFLLAIACGTAALYAQNPTGLIKGRVTDSGQGAVPSAGVQMVSQATNVTTRTQTNDEGNYVLRGLLPGEYRLEVRKNGFKVYSQEPIEVRVGDIVSPDVALQFKWAP